MLERPSKTPSQQSVRESGANFDTVEIWVWQSHVQLGQLCLSRHRTGFEGVMLAQHQQLVLHLNLHETVDHTVKQPQIWGMLMGAEVYLASCSAAPRADQLSAPRLHRLP